MENHGIFCPGKRDGRRRGERLVLSGEMGILSGTPPWGPWRGNNCGAELLHPWPLHLLAVLGENPHSHPHVLQMPLEPPGLVEGVPLGG